MCVETNGGLRKMNWFCFFVSLDLALVIYFSYSCQRSTPRGQLGALKE